MLDGYVPSLIIMGVTAIIFTLRWFYFSRLGKSAPLWFDIMFTAIIIALAAVLEYAMGRVWICKCGYIKFWHGIVFSSENSQHISDWYTFSHIIHGFGFYGLLWLFLRKVPLSLRLALAVMLETAWEVLENTTMVIDRYRAVTISLDYFGDSILNSTMDTLAMVVGFILASRLPVWLVIVLTIIMEVGVAYFIRDNLTLNIIMLIYPAQAILKWQAGG
ncbi:MAG: DUF2585 domain-containing protein [Patescibacteria group bacterium]